MNQDPLDQLLQQQFDSALRDLTSDGEVDKIVRRILQRDRLRGLVFGIALLLAAAISMFSLVNALTLLNPVAWLESVGLGNVAPAPSLVLAALLAFIVPLVAWALDDAL